MTVFASLSEQEKLRARAINLLNDYTQNGMIFSGNSTSSTDYLMLYQSVLDDFKKHQVVKYQISPSTLVKYNDYLGKFLLYLEEHHISSLQQITTGIIQDYCNTFATYSTATTHKSLCSLRVFLRYFETERACGE